MAEVTNLTLDEASFYRLAIERVTSTQAKRSLPKAARHRITKARLLSDIRQIPDPKYLVLPQEPHNTPTGSAIGVVFRHTDNTGRTHYRLRVYVRKGPDNWTLYQFRLQINGYANRPAQLHTTWLADR